MIAKSLSGIVKVDNQERPLCFSYDVEKDILTLLVANVKDELEPQPVDDFTQKLFIKGTKLCVGTRYERFFTECLPRWIAQNKSAGSPAG